MALIKIFGDDAGTGNRGPAFRYQHRRGARGVQRKKCLAALPHPLFHQPQIKAVFAERQADEARMRTEHHPFCPHSRFIRLALGEYGLDLRLVEERVWERREAFLALNPAGTTPVLIDEGW